MKNDKKKIQKKVIRAEQRAPKKAKKDSEIVKLRINTKESMDLKDSRLTKTKEFRKYH